MKILSKSAIVILCLMIAACGLFSKDKEILEGERISVLKETAAIKPELQENETKIRLPRPVTNNEWSQRGGNSQHVMHHLMSSRELEKAWSASFGKGDSKRDFLIAEPIIAHQVVFTIDADAVVSAFRQDSGKRIWKKRLKPLIKTDKNIAMKGAGLAIYNKTIYATTGFGSVFAMNMIDGEILWRYNTETPIRIAPTVGKGKVFVQTIDNFIIAVDAENGQELWKQKSSSESTTFVGGASPAFDEAMDVVIAAFTNGELRAFKASTGSPLWSDYLISKKRTYSLANINAIKANPVIYNGVVYAAGTNSSFVALDLRSGARIWEKEIGMSNQPWIAGNYIFAVSDNSDLFAIERATGKIIWNINIPLAANLKDKVGVFISGPILVNNRLIVATSNGYAFAVSPYVGKILSYMSLDEGVVLPPIAANNMVIFTTNDAEILAFK